MDDAHAISSAARVATVASSSVHTAVVGREARLVGGVNVSACTSTNGAGGGDGGDGGGGLGQAVPSPVPAMPLVYDVPTLPTLTRHP
jgi:hypothetical protein